MSTNSPLLDMANEIHAKFKKFMDMIPGPSDTPSDATPEHEKAAADMKAQANAHNNDAANASFAEAAAKMKSEGHTYDSNRPKVQVRSRYTK
jgi:hypothetical protein